MNWLYRLFRQVTPLTAAQQELQRSELQLLAYQALLEDAQAAVNANQQRIKRLKAYTEVAA